MRKCLRCGTEMKENCAIKVEGAGYGIYNVIGRKQAVRRQNGETEGSNLSEVRRSLHLCGRCREAVTVNGGCMK